MRVRSARLHQWKTSSRQLLHQWKTSSRQLNAELSRIAGFLLLLLLLLLLLPPLPPLLLQQLTMTQASGSLCVTLRTLTLARCNPLTLQPTLCFISNGFQLAELVLHLPRERL